MVPSSMGKIKYKQEPEFYYLKNRNTTLGFAGSSAVKNLPAMQETFNPWVGEIPWRREWLTTLSFKLNFLGCILAWEIPWTEEPGRLQFMELQKVQYEWTTTTDQGSKGRGKERQGTVLLGCWNEELWCGGRSVGLRQADLVTWLPFVFWDASLRLPYLPWWLRW